MNDCGARCKTGTMLQRHDGWVGLEWPMLRRCHHQCPVRGETSSNNYRCRHRQCCRYRKRKSQTKAEGREADFAAFGLHSAEVDAQKRTEAATTTTTTTTTMTATTIVVINSVWVNNNSLKKVLVGNKLEISNV